MTVMEPSRAIRLLAGTLRQSFDARTLERGSAYARAGRVGDILMHEAAGGRVQWSAPVQGSEPYTAHLEVRERHGEVRLDAWCSCPVGSHCKHSVAVAVVLLSQAAASDDSPGRRFGAWDRWLQELPAALGTAAERADEEAPRHAAIVLHHDGAPLPRLTAVPVWVRQGVRRGWVDPQPMRPQADGRNLTGETFRLVADLRMQPPSLQSIGGFLLAGEHAGEWLARALAGRIPVFLERPAAGSLSAGPERALRIGWEARDDGSQKLALAVDGAPGARLLVAGGLWYLLPAERILGPVQGEPRLAEAVLRSPALQPEQVPLLRERWGDQPLLAALPRPPAAPEVERVEGRPEAVLTLRSVELARRGEPRRQVGAARLAFDYGGVRLPLHPVEPLSRRRRGERIVEVVRDRAFETAAAERLDAAGLLPSGVLAPGHRELDENDFLLDRGRGATSSDPLFALAPELQELGFRLESEQGFPFELVGTPADWIVEVEEDGSNPWFDLRLGVEVQGERVDLLPVLQRLLADPAFPLEPRPGEAADAHWLVALDERRRAMLPLARLRALMAPLLEWLQGGSRGVEGALRLRRAQADVAERLAEAGGQPWRGGERLRADREALRGPHAPAEQPAGLNATLRGYQREGLAWLGVLERAGLGGVLADDMGLGKTIQVLAHLQAMREGGRLGRPALVLAPTSLVGNWADEAARFVPDLRVLVIHGPDRHGLHASIGQHDLVITTYPLLLRDRDALLEEEYSVLVLDEAQAIKNVRSQAARAVRRIEAGQRVAMTGTPLENHLGELWAQFDAVEPGLLGNERQFNRFYRTPIERHGDTERRERLGRRIAPLLLRRRKDEVLAELPEKTEIVRRIELEGGQRELYETLRLAQHARVRDEIRRRGLAQSGIVVLDALLKLRQICCDPRLVKLESARTVSESAKLDALLELLDSLVDEGRRVLLFSQFTSMLDLIGAALGERALPYLRLTGETPSTVRGERVRQFQEGGVPLFLISLRAGGTGLNLTAADTVIHYDPWWNPAVERQATDRAHRIGQDKPVFVYRLICAGTVEEKIHHLQQRKADLADAILEGGSSRSARFDEADLAELFAPLDPDAGPG